MHFMRALQRGIGGKSFCYEKVYLHFTLLIEYPHVVTIQQRIIRRDLCNNTLDNLLSKSSVRNQVYILWFKICGHMKINQICSYNIEA